MKLKSLILLACMLLLSQFSLANQKQPPNYYRVDKIKTITGDIVAVKSERSFHKKDFTVLYLKEEKSKEIYRVEVSPKWFYTMDLMIGSRIKVIGSYTRKSGIHMIMTRTITSQGKLFLFRDKHGFPMWRGGAKGKMKGRGKGRGQRRSGKGSKGHRGNH